MLALRAPRPRGAARALGPVAAGSDPPAVRRSVVVVLAAGLLAALLVVVAGARLAGHLGGLDPDREIARAPAGSALALLGTVAVHARSTRAGYGREQFGAAWADVDGDGCDTRDDVLVRDLTHLAFRAGQTCVVASGVLADPYGHERLRFVRGAGSSLVQIDHVVALSDAWQTGARGWTADEREDFANDPLNLLAVDGPLNQEKGDADAAGWLPPHRAYQCPYVARQVAVKAKYRAWVTPAERRAMARVLSRCPAQRPPVDPGTVEPVEPSSS